MNHNSLELPPASLVETGRKAASKLTGASREEVLDCSAWATQTPSDRDVQFQRFAMPWVRTTGAEVCLATAGRALKTTFALLQPAEAWKRTAATMPDEVRLHWTAVLGQNSSRMGWPENRAGETESEGVPAFDTEPGLDDLVEDDEEDNEDDLVEPTGLFNCWVLCKPDALDNNSTSLFMGIFPRRKRIMSRQDM
jgi:hypothetical protein